MSLLVFIGFPGPVPIIFLGGGGGLTHLYANLLKKCHPVGELNLELSKLRIENKEQNFL